MHLAIKTNYIYINNSRSSLFLFKQLDLDAKLEFCYCPLTLSNIPIYFLSFSVLWSDHLWVMILLVILGAGIGGVPMAYEMKETVGKKHDVIVISDTSTLYRSLGPGRCR
jgi:hypothetical protein